MYRSNDGRGESACGNSVHQILLKWQAAQNSGKVTR